MVSMQDLGAGESFNLEHRFGRGCSGQSCQSTNPKCQTDLLLGSVSCLAAHSDVLFIILCFHAHLQRNSLMTVISQLACSGLLRSGCSPVVAGRLLGNLSWGSYREMPGSERQRAGPHSPRFLAFSEITTDVTVFMRLLFPERLLFSRQWLLGDVAESFHHICFTFTGHKSHGAGDLVILWTVHQ